MDKILQLIKSEYKDVLLDIALLKDVLYKVVTKDNVFIVTEFLVEQVERIKEASKDIMKSTNAETFLKNLVKDKSE